MSRAAALSLLLVLVVIAAAGVSGTAHFRGLRWSLHASTTSHAAKLPPVRTTTTAPRPQPRPSGGVAIPIWVWIALGTVGVLIAAGLIWRWLARRRAPSAPRLQASAAQTTRVAAADDVVEPEALLTGIALALARLDEEREPRDAIVRAWLGLEETAQESGIVRGASETPTEFTSRVLASAFADDQATRTLLRLYLRTRFGDHPPTAEDVSAVRAALSRLVEDWQAHADTITAGR